MRVLISSLALASLVWLYVTMTALVEWYIGG